MPTVSYIFIIPIADTPVGRVLDMKPATGSPGLRRRLLAQELLTRTKAAGAGDETGDNAKPSLTKPLPYSPPLQRRVTPRTRPLNALIDRSVTMETCEVGDNTSYKHDKTTTQDKTTKSYDRIMDKTTTKQTVSSNEESDLNCDPVSIETDKSSENKSEVTMVTQKPMSVIEKFKMESGMNKREPMKRSYSAKECSISNRGDTPTKERSITSRGDTPATLLARSTFYTPSDLDHSTPSRDTGSRELTFSVKKDNKLLDTSKLTKELRAVDREPTYV